MTDRNVLVGLILAGGLSRRMGGREKAFLPLAGRPLIARVIERLGSQVATLVINANGDPARFADFALPVVADTIPGFAGPLAGILAGMRWSAENRPAATHVVSVATDTPFFPADLAKRLAGACRTSDTIAIAASDGSRHPVFGCWPVALADDLDGFLAAGETGKVMAFAQRHRVADVEFRATAIGGQTMDPFFNINTPDDLEQARRLIEGAGNVATA